MGSTVVRMMGLQPEEMVRKSGKGQQMLRARSPELPPRLRSLLIMVDGRQTLAWLRDAAATLGAPADAIERLLAEGLIETTPVAGAAAAPAAATTPTAPAGGPSAAKPGDQSAVQQARQLMNDVVVDQLGVRALFFTLKIERCFGRDDLVALLPEFERQLGKGKNPDDARRLVQRVRNLLG